MITVNEIGKIGIVQQLYKISWINACKYLRMGFSAIFRAADLFLRVAHNFNFFEWILFCEKIRTKINHLLYIWNQSPDKIEAYSHIMIFFSIQEFLFGGRKQTSWKKCGENNHKNREPSFLSLTMYAISVGFYSFDWLRKPLFSYTHLFWFFLICVHFFR